MEIRACEVKYQRGITAKNFVIRPRRVRNYVTGFTGLTSVRNFYIENCFNARGENEQLRLFVKKFVKFGAH